MPPGSEVASPRAGRFVGIFYFLTRGLYQPGLHPELWFQGQGKPLLICDPAMASEPVACVDQFDQEFSRDIEPVKGLHGDNYYYQTVPNARRFKGEPPLPAASAVETIRRWAGRRATRFSSISSVGITGSSPAISWTPT